MYFTSWITLLDKKDEVVKVRQESIEREEKEAEQKDWWWEEEER